MPGFFYLLRGRDQDAVTRDGHLDAARLRANGLGEVLADVVDVPDDCMVSGPVTLENIADHLGDVSGVILYPKSRTGTDPNSWTYNAGQQTWQPVGDGETLWIGWQTNSPPAPEDLARKVVLGDRQVEDQANRAWTLYAARSPHGRAHLPASYRFGEVGPTRVVDAQYQAWWDLSADVRDWLHDRYTPKDQESWKVRTALTILQCNYRIGPAEVNVLQELGLGVIRSDNTDRILLHFVDWDLPEELADQLQKKTETAST